MKKIVELPLAEPVYSTYHHHGACSAATAKNTTIQNWFFNEVMILRCTRKFLSGYTTPELLIAQSSWFDCPHFDKRWFPTDLMGGYIHPVMRNLIDAGFYVCFSGVDDYYVEGKTWYKERHFAHDGLICGYNQQDKTYCLYAYDSNWIYSKFWTPQKGFELGRRAMGKKGRYDTFCAIRPKMNIVEFSHETALKKIEEYLDSDFEKYPETDEGYVYGIVVHDYIVKYIDKLLDGSIPYEKMDRRIFRLIWEHKKVMLERIQRIENSLHMDESISKRYKKVVSDADSIRMMYASHFMKRRDSILPVISRKLIALKIDEEKLLKELLEKQKG